MVANYLRVFSNWVDEADWRSWLVHGVLCWPIAVVLGPVTAIAFFVLREAEQLAHELMAGARPPWLDHALDIVAPAVVAIWLT